MPDKRTSFAGLEDIDNDNQGIALSQAIEGDPIAGRNFAGSLVAKDASNNLAFLKVNASGSILVDTNSQAACLTGEGSVVNVTTETLIAKIILQASTDYSDLEVFLSCFRDTKARVVYVEDVGVTDVETELIPGVRLTAGQGSYSETFSSLGKFTTGATGVHELQLLAQVLNPASGSDVDAALGICELQ